MIDRARVDVAEGKPVEEEGVRRPRRSLVRRHGVAQEIAVREHHTLRIARRAGRVHDGSERVGVEGVVAALELGGDTAERAASALKKTGPAALLPTGTRRDDRP